MSIGDNSNDERQWLTVNEVAERLKVSRDTVERWICAGDLRAVDVSSRVAGKFRRSAWRINIESLEVFLADRANKAVVHVAGPRRVRMPGVIEFIK